MSFLPDSRLQCKISPIFLLGCRPVRHLGRFSRRSLPSAYGRSHHSEGSRPPPVHHTVRRHSLLRNVSLLTLRHTLCARNEILRFQAATKLDERSSTTLIHGGPLASQFTKIFNKYTLEILLRAHLPQFAAIATRVNFNSTPRPFNLRDNTIESGSPFYVDGI